MTRRDLLTTLSVSAVGAMILPSAKMYANPTRAVQPLTPDLEHARRSCIWACWVGHATVLLRIGNAWVLTDPVLFDAYGIQIFGATLGPRRRMAPAFTVDTMPKPDLVLLSHAHLDHMDIKTLSALADLYPNEIDVITAKNTMDVIADLEWKSINEIDWGEKVSVHGFDLHALEVQHNGARWPGEACRANGQPRTGRSYNGYYMSYEGSGVVFGGDTAHTDHFRNVPGTVDLAIMPIGAYGSCKDVHCTPEQALDMARMMDARLFMPIHHSTFNQVEEPITEPLQRLCAALKKEGSHPNLAAHTAGHAIQVDLASTTLPQQDLWLPSATSKGT